jgi:TRAP-type C4-dicarboxylate transport system permease small subunit
MGLMALLVILAVILRYIFGIGFMWVTELVTYLFIFDIFFGSAIGIIKKDHIVVDVFLKKMPKNVQYILNVITEIIIIIVQVQVIRSSIQWISKTGGIRTPGLNMPSIYIYTVIPIGAVFIMFNTFRILLIYSSQKIKSGDIE